MAESLTVIPPDFTGVVNQEFFIEPLGGPSNPQSYLGNFPEQIFTHDINSNLVALLYALLGPAGVGAIRQNFLLSRLAVEAAGLSTVDLDYLYANPFNFARLAQETYAYIPQGLLTTAQWEHIQKSDAAFRNRAIDFLKAIRAGGTLQGLTLAAKSGLNHPAEIIENYRALFDHFSDSPLGLAYLGATQSTEEVIVLPRQDIPKSSEQIIAFAGEPIAGTFTIQLPIGNETNSITSAIPYNATFDVVETALEELAVVGSANVQVQGGPAPNIPLKVLFTGALADQELPILIVKAEPTMLNAESELAIPTVEETQAGLSADGEQSAIAAQDWFYASTAIEEIKPVTTIITPGKAPGLVKRQPTNLVHSDSSFTEVVRYVTGQSSVRWPAVNSTHWIVGGREIEAPLAKNAQRSHYTNFHNVKTVNTYTEAALADSEYESSSWPMFSAPYVNEHTGPFSLYEQALFPVLGDFTDPTFKFVGGYSLANPPEPPTVQAVAQEESTNLIANLYPSDYRNLPGVTKIPTTNYFWASAERVSGADYLEIDLGSVQAVNFISFQATNKPYDLDVAYDVLDMTPARRFIPVTLAPIRVAASTTSLGYTTSPNPWRTCKFYFTNTLGTPIYTRVLRIGFTRRLGGQNPYVIAGGTKVPYGIEVRNLRVGRNL